MNKEQEAVLSKEKLQGMLGLKGAPGRWITTLLYNALEINKVNATQAKFASDNAPDFAAHVLEDVGCRYVLPEGSLDRIPAEGGFITVSNHHFGSIDGLILCDTVGRKRKDYKLLTTFMLSLVPNLREGFLPVDNISGKTDARSVNSIRTALRHIADGGAIGFFPAGEVATYQKGDARTAVSDIPVIEDKPWAPNIIKLIQKSKLPVIPIYFDGANSSNFHALGKIHPRLRTVRLIHELFNKKGTVVQVRIGQPISADEIASMDLDTLGAYLRNRTYALEASCRETPAPKELPSTPQLPIAEPEDPALVRAELEGLPGRILFESGNYRCYFTPAADIPHTLREIARLREAIFRAVGEGTGQPLDTDIYDTYYRHLILWNIPDGRIAGAYRIGMGNELMARPEGYKAFYTSTLFTFREKLFPYLSQTMELGRTIVCPEYQRDIMTLKLLLSGILTVSVKNGLPHALGPASISNSLPDFYKSLIVWFYQKHCAHPSATDMALPTHPFKPNYLRVNPEGLLSGCKTVDELDRLILAISGGQYRLPVLLRKYVSLGAKLITFNIDPDFCDCLDAFVLLDMENLPENSYRSFSRFITPEA